MWERFVDLCTSPLPNLILVSPSCLVPDFTQCLFTNPRASTFPLWSLRPQQNARKKCGRPLRYRSAKIRVNCIFPRVSVNWKVSTVRLCEDPDFCPRSRRLRTRLNSRQQILMSQYYHFSYHCRFLLVSRREDCDHSWSKERDQDIEGRLKTFD